MYTANFRLLMTISPGKVRDLEVNMPHKPFPNGYDISDIPFLGDI